MATTSKRKNPAAVALSKRRLVTMTAEERSDVARNSVQARWRKARGEQPKRWHVLFATDDPNHLQILDSDTDRARLLKRVRARPDYWTRPMFVDYIEYNPTHFTVERRFQPDGNSQIRALGVLIDSEGGAM